MTLEFTLQMQMGPEEMAQQLGELPTPADNLGSVPSTYRLLTNSGNSSFRGFGIFFWPLQKSACMHTCNTQAHIYTLNKQENK